MKSDKYINAFFGDWRSERKELQDSQWASIISAHVIFLRTDWQPRFSASGKPVRKYDFSTMFSDRM